jgi:uncharacterized membrane protein YedE/YeeE
MRALRTLTWWQGGLALGGVFLLAVALVKPIGVSTQFVIADGIIWSWFDPGLIGTAEDGATTSSNPYLAKSGGKYAQAVAAPLSYGFIFVLAMVAGAALSTWLGGPRPTPAERRAPAVWTERFGGGSGRRYLTAFLGGALVLFGARLAGGCTSGHMMSGIMQTAVSGYLFAAAVFAVGIPTAILIFRRHGGMGGAS